jgi:hypothetical protein
MAYREAERHSQGAEADIDFVSMVLSFKKFSAEERECLSWMKSTVKTTEPNSA